MDHVKMKKSEPLIESKSLWFNSVVKMVLPKEEEDKRSPKSSEVSEEGVEESLVDFTSGVGHHENGDKDIKDSVQEDSVNRETVDDKNVPKPSAPSYLDDLMGLGEDETGQNQNKNSSPAGEEEVGSSSSLEEFVKQEEAIIAEEEVKDNQKGQDDTCNMDKGLDNAKTTPTTIVDENNNNNAYGSEDLITSSSPSSGKFSVILNPELPKIRAQQIQNWLNFEKEENESLKDHHKDKNSKDKDSLNSSTSSRETSPPGDFEMDSLTVEQSQIQQNNGGTTSSFINGVKRRVRFLTDANGNLKISVFLTNADGEEEEEEIDLTGNDGQLELESTLGNFPAEMLIESQLAALMGSSSSSGSSMILQNKSDLVDTDKILKELGVEKDEIDKVGGESSSSKELLPGIKEESPPPEEEEDTMSNSSDSCSSMIEIVAKQEEEEKNKFVETLVDENNNEEENGENETKKLIPKINDEDEPAKSDKKDKEPGKITQIAYEPQVIKNPSVEEEQVELFLKRQNTLVLNLENVNKVKDEPKEEDDPKSFVSTTTSVKLVKVEHKISQNTKHPYPLTPFVKNTPENPFPFNEDTRKNNKDLGEVENMKTSIFVEHNPEENGQNQNHSSEESSEPQQEDQDNNPGDGHLESLRIEEEPISAVAVTIAKWESFSKRQLKPGSESSNRVKIAVKGLGKLILPVMGGNGGNHHHETFLKKKPSGGNRVGPGQGPGQPPPDLPPPPPQKPMRNGNNGQGQDLQKFIYQEEDEEESIYSQPVTQPGPLNQSTNSISPSTLLKLFPKPNSRGEIVNWFKEGEIHRSGILLSFGTTNHSTHIIAQPLTNPIVVSWFFGLITRQQAEELLCGQPNGTFLVRISTRIWGYTLSYQCNNKTKHFLISAINPAVPSTLRQPPQHQPGTHHHPKQQMLSPFSPGGRYAFVGTNMTPYPTLASLIRHHTHAPITKVGGEKLEKPCPTGPKITGIEYVFK